MRYLLDTNILAETTKPQPNPAVLDRLNQFNQEIAIASITWHELWFGIERLPQSRKRQSLESYMDRLLTARLPILPYTAEAARWLASERSRLVALGLSPSYSDGQIASISHVNGLTLVTRNVSDFENFNELSLENWFES